MRFLATVGILGLVCSPAVAEPAPAPASAPASQSTPASQSASPVQYGTIDAASVRVFAVGTVGTRVVSYGGVDLTLAVPVAGHGTGFAVAPGLLLTAYHVVDGARHIVVRLPGDNGFRAARLVVGGRETDVAVLRVEAELPALEIDAASALHVRQTVYAIGYPLDPRRNQAQSSRGIVAGHTEGRLQLDMALNPGNSGGALVDERDRVVGMVVARGNVDAGVQGMGFAVPAERLAAYVAHAQKRVSGGDVKPFTDSQRVSAGVVDELIRRGVFEEVHGVADLDKELATGELSESIAALIARVNDPDLLTFVGGQLWNVQVYFENASLQELDALGLTRGRASRLASRLGSLAGRACGKARRVDPSVAARSPIVATVLASWTAAGDAVEADAAPEPVGPAVVRRSSPRAFSALGRFSLVGQSVPAIDDVAIGVGVGFAVRPHALVVPLGAWRIRPAVGFALGVAKAATYPTSNVFAVSVGVDADLRLGDAGLWLSAEYAPAMETLDETTAMRALRGRFALGARFGSVHLGAGVSKAAESPAWVEPFLLGYAF